jgi:hypothetical protein
MATTEQNIIIGLNAFNSTAKISNANWESKINTPITINPNDSIYIKNSYIDARLHNSSNILLEEDTTVVMEMMFYYINRGGCNQISLDISSNLSAKNGKTVIGPTLVNPSPLRNPSQIQQVKASEYGALPDNPTLGVTKPYLNYPPGFNPDWAPPFPSTANPLGQVSGLPLSVLTPQTIQNMTPVVETIYSCPMRPLTGLLDISTNPINRVAEFLDTQIGNQLRYTNAAAFCDSMDITSADGLPYLMYMCGPMGTEYLPAPTCGFAGDYGGNDRFSASFMEANGYDGANKNNDGIIPIPPEPYLFVYGSINGTIVNTDFNALIISNTLNLPDPNMVYIQEHNNITDNPDILYQLRLEITWGANGIYQLTQPEPPTQTTNTVIRGKDIQVGDTFTIKGSNIGPPQGPKGVDGINDCVITIVDRSASTYGAPSDWYEAVALGLSISGNAIIPNNPAEDVQGLIPYTKEFRYTIPAGSYTPDKIAELMTTAMSNMNQKVTRNFYDYSAANPSSTYFTYDMLIEPTELLHNQNYGTTNASSIQTKNGIYNTTLSTVPLGPFNDYVVIPAVPLPDFPKHQVTGNYLNNTDTYESWNGTTPQIQTTNMPPGAHVPTAPNFSVGNNENGFVFQFVDVTRSRPPTQFISKNYKSYPFGLNQDAISLTNLKLLNPDYNSPIKPKDVDACPFICRPLAACVPFICDSTMGIVGNQVNMPITGLSHAHTLTSSQCQLPAYKLYLNDDYNETLNNLQEFYPYTSEFVPPIPSIGPAMPQFKVELMYMPFITDVQSNYFINKQRLGFPNEKPTMKYGIRPILSTQKIPYGVTSSSATGNTTPTITNGVTDISTPVIGAAEIALQYNQNNDNLFSFSYAHTPIYAKPDTSTADLVESTAQYPTTYYTNSNNNGIIKKAGVVTATRQSGIIFRKLLAFNQDGTPSNFWKRLGFNVEDITADYDPDKPSDPFMTWNEFQDKTTFGFIGTANTFQPQLHACGLNEWSPLSYKDSLSMTGWWTLGDDVTVTATGVDVLPFTEYGNQQVKLNQVPLYTAVNGITKQLAAKDIAVDEDDTGHYLIEITGFNTTFVNETEKNEVKSIVSSYYVSQNSFVSNAMPENFIYYHHGQPMKLSQLKVRILNPKTLQEMPQLGPNTSVYLGIAKQFGKIFQAELPNTME